MIWYAKKVMKFPLSCLINHHGCIYQQSYHQHRMLKLWEEKKFCYLPPPPLPQQQQYRT